jgi:hypothetical protein
MGLFSDLSWALSNKTAPPEDWSIGDSPKVGIEPTLLRLDGVADDQVAAGFGIEGFCKRSKLIQF